MRSRGDAPTIFPLRLSIVNKLGAPGANADDAVNIGTKLILSNFWCLTCVRDTMSGSAVGLAGYSRAMSMKTLLDDAGRIQLPVSVQTQLGVKPGDELTLEEENGNWLIKPAGLAANGPPLGNGVDDLNWEELDYQAVPLNRSRNVAVRIEHRGKLQPMAHELEEE